MALRRRSYHRRDWRRLWRYCRCGYRWRCPDSIELVPAAPYRPSAPPSAAELAKPAERVGLTAAERAEIRALTPDTSAPPPRPRATNHRPGWDAPTRSHLANGRAGALTPAQEHHARRHTRA